MKKLFLFDMDGTLTPPRKQMRHDILAALKTIQIAGYEIGIITGSDMEYIREQCYIMFDLSPIDPRTIHFLPCNGTKYYYKDKWMYKQNMKASMTKAEWNRLVFWLLNLQVDFFRKNNISLSGHFIDYRESILNWCPIGRCATTEERENFVDIDKQHGIRKKYLGYLRDVLRSDGYGLTVKLGGDTSFDIYPNGWDKTYPLEKQRYFNRYDIYFVGDRCGENGNDKELYEHHRTISKQTTSPEQTIEIIQEFLEMNNIHGKDV